MEAIDRIADILGSSFSYDTIQIAFIDCESDPERTINYLLSQPTPLNESQHVPIVAKGVEPRAKITFMNDLEVYCQLENEYQDLIDSGFEFGAFWKNIRKEFPSGAYDHDFRYYEAKRQLESILASKKSIQISAGNPSANASYAAMSSEMKVDAALSDDEFYGRYLLMFEDKLSIAQLTEIWHGIELPVPEDHYNIAFMYAAEAFDELLYGTPDVTPAPTVDFVDLTNDEDEDDDMIPPVKGGYQPQSSSQNQRKKARASDKRTVEEVVVTMLIEMFDGSGVLESRIREIAAQCNYDIETAIEVVVSDYKARQNIVRENISYSAMASSSDSNATTKMTTASSSSASSFPAISPCNGQLKQVPSPPSRPILAVAAPPPVAVAATAPVTQQSLSLEYCTVAKEANLRKGPHYGKQSEFFLKVCRQKNPMLEIDLDNSLMLSLMGLGKRGSVLRYEGQRVPVMTVKIDLHGLIVARSLEFVESSMNYLYRNRQELKNRYSKIMVSFIVGKGIHSVGGIPKLKPAVQQYLMNRGERNFVPYEGEVMVCITL